MSLMTKMLGGACLLALVLAPGAGVAQTGELVDRTTLRVCADPHNLPYSNQAGEGFENKIAELFAARLDLPLDYTWFPQTVGFVRNTLGARRCDLVIGVATTNELMQNSNPYYRSSYVLIQRADAEPKIRSLDDPALQAMRIGAVVRTPPVTLMAMNGLADNLVGYHLVVDTRVESPGRQMVEDLAAGKIDAGVLWGPIAGYWATRQGVPIEVAPLLGENAGVRMDFRISMGMRRNEPEWKLRVNDLLAENQAAIQAILLEYGVPLLDNQGKLIEPPAEETRGDVAPVLEPAGYRMAEYRAPVPATLAGATVVDTEGLQQLLATGQPILIDVLPAPRAPKDRPADRLWRPTPHTNIPGSVWLANVGYGELSAEFESYFRDHLARLTADDPGRPLVFYCQADCWMSWNAAKRALAYGYRNVVWYPPGTDGWQAAGLALAPAEPEPMPDFVPLTQPAAAGASG